MSTLLFPRIPILFAVIGTATFKANAALPVGAQVLLTVPCCVDSERGGLLYPSADYPRDAVQRELNKQYGLVLTKDHGPARLIQSWGEGWNQYLHYPAEGLAIAPGSVTRHAHRCPHRGSDEWNPNCVDYGCAYEPFQWGWHVTFARWHTSDVDGEDGTIHPLARRRDSITGWYTIAGEPRRYAQSLFPSDPRAYGGYRLCMLDTYLRRAGVPAAAGRLR